MILAAPLVIPFAEAVGLSVATLGMAKVADMVNEYIQENPEQSMKILSTIVPGVGIGEIFMKKGKDEEVEEDIEVEDVDARDLTKKEKAKKMKEIVKEGGNLKETMKKGYEEIILPGKEDEMLDEAEDRYEGGVEEVTRPKFDYKKFFKKRYADGGSIGIEVLFEPKRKDFNIGGRAKPTQTFDPRASALDYATALDKVGAGTAAQKRQSLSDYLGNVISTQGQKLGNAAVIPLQAAKGVLGIQGTPITDSMQSSLQNIIQKQIKDSGKLSGNLNYLDYGVLTDRKGQEFLGFGDRSFTDPEAALATTLGKASYAVDPKTGKITFTGGTAYDFGDDQFGGLGKFISKGGAFNQLPSASNKFQPGATEYNPNITLGSDFMKQFNQPKYPDYKTAALQSQFYKNNPTSLDFDLFRAAYADPQYNRVRTTKDGQIVTDFGNWDPSRTYSAYKTNTQTSNQNPFWQGAKYPGFQERKDRLAAMYGLPGNINPYYANGGRVGLFMGGDPLTGQALAIYNSMNAYGFDDQAIANALTEQGLYTPGSSTPETTAPNIINQQLQTGGGGDNNFGGQGIGAFGNLDPNTKKTMQVEMADGKGGVVIKEVDTYLDAGGLRKTLDNKNPVNAGIDIKPMAVTIMEALMGKKTDDEFDPEGKIYGTFNNPNYKDLSFFGKIKADYSRQKELKQLQKEFELQEKLKAQIAEEQKQAAFNQARSDRDRAISSGLDAAIKEGRDTSGFDRPSSGAYAEGAGMGVGGGYASDYGFLKDGGLATMFKEKR